MDPAALPAPAWLAILCAPPLLVVIVLSLLPKRSSNGGPVRLGNPLLKRDVLPAPQSAVLSPLLHLTRTQSDADLRALILGLRHMPITDTAFILRRYLHSSDPELQLYSQSILQDKQGHLQSAFARFLPLATVEAPAHLASCIEAGLNLAKSPLTPDSEFEAIMRKVAPKAELVLSSDITHPRALAAAARFFARSSQIEQAESLLARLPKGSPLQQSVSALVTHHKAILHPPPPLTSGYTIQ